LDEFYKVSVCESAKEMWDVLEVTHEDVLQVTYDGTNEVKRSKNNSHSGVWHVQDESWEKHLRCVEKIHSHSEPSTSFGENVEQRGTKHKDFKESK